MSYNSSFTGQQADAALQKAAVIQTGSDGTKFLADDGTYKEAGDKTNVLILSLENDLAGGQKDSPVNAEVSASLVDAITTGKACVIKSANSDILANLQKIGNNVTIILEQISRVGQTFVAVNTSITVNTSTNVIADYQTGAIVLETEGDGSKFLANDGTYKEIASSNQYLDMSIFTGESGTLSEEDYQKVVNAFTNKVSVGAVQEAFMPISISDLSDKYEIYVNATGPGESYLGVGVYIYSINKADKTFTFTGNGVRIENSGDGTKFLSDDGMYKSVSSGSTPYIYNLPIEFYQALASEQKVSFTMPSENIQSLKSAVESDRDIMIKFEIEDSSTINMTFSPCMAAYNGSAIEIHFSVISGITDMYAVYMYIAEDGSQSTIEAFKIARQKQLSDASNLNISTVDPESFSEDISSYFNGENDQYGIRRFFIISDFVVTVCSGITGQVECGDLKRLPDGSVVEFYVDSIYNDPDYTYTLKCRYVERVLSESEYAALGTTPETDNVLYFVTPD